MHKNYWIKSNKIRHPIKVFRVNFKCIRFVHDQLIIIHTNVFYILFDYSYILASAITDMNRTRTIIPPPNNCDSSGTIWDTGEVLFE